MGRDLDINFYVKSKITNTYIQRITDALIAEGAKFLPFVSDAHPKTTINTEIKELVSGRRSINFSYKQLCFFLSAYNELEKGSGLAWIPISFPQINFDPQRVPAAEENVASLIKVAKTIWSASSPKPVYGFADSETMADTCRDKLAAKNILSAKVPALFWLNFFGKKYVRKLGKEQLLSAPVYEAEEIEEGIMIRHSRFPEEYLLPKKYTTKYLADREAQEQIAKLLGLDWAKGGEKT